LSIVPALRDLFEIADPAMEGKVCMSFPVQERPLTSLVIENHFASSADDHFVETIRHVVLIVDDEPSILAMLVNQLSVDFDIITACSVEQAKRCFQQHKPDIVLSDLQLHDGNGIQLLDWVYRTAPKTARMLLTGTARVEDAADAINCSRIHRLMLKPWRSEDLLETLRSMARTLHLERSHELLLTQLRRSHLELERRVQDRTKELELTNQQLQMKNQILEKMALTDALTSLPNRRAIELVARKELLRRTRHPAAIAFGLVDADRFKLINSRYLLCGGDHVLTWLAQTLQRSIRSSDSLGRVGGEEFMVVAPATDHAGIAILAERLRSNVAEQPTIYQDDAITVTVSVGFAICPADVPVNYERLRESASAALAEAKATGRNRCVTHLVS
jgi:diguanylate cyclase